MIVRFRVARYSVLCNLFIWIVFFFLHYIVT